MVARVWPGMVLSIALTGCVSDGQKLTSVSSSPFGGPTRTRSAWMKQAPPATQKVSLRVNEIGQKISAANSRLDRKIAFLTLGVPQQEIFHRVRGGNGEIYITEGLVNQCKTDGELAAVLSREMGKIMSEEIAKARPMRELPEPPPMMSPHIGNDIEGPYGSPDRTDMVIAARYEADRKWARRSLVAPPSADDLARDYLQKAGFNEKNLATVKPLLRQAGKNDNLESLMTGRSAR